MKVLKFGGTSVEQPRVWHKVKILSKPLTNSAAGGGVGPGRRDRSPGSPCPYGQPRATKRYETVYSGTGRTASQTGQGRGGAAERQTEPRWHKWMPCSMNCGIFLRRLPHSGPYPQNRQCHRGLRRTPVVGSS